jgi:hypothetical protein
VGPSPTVFFGSKKKKNCAYRNIKDIVKLKTTARGINNVMILIPAPFSIVNLIMPLILIPRC